MTSDGRICRLCFEDVQEKYVQNVNKNIQVMLQTLLINIDISSSEHSGICTTCQEKLEKCYYFKKKCMFTEEALGPFITENVKINLNEIFTTINKSEDVDEDKSVCRLCLQYNDDDMILNKDEKEQFKALFPEINLYLTSTVMLCLTCYDMLQKYFLFVPLFSISEKPSQHKFVEDSDSKQDYGSSLEGCQEFTRSAEKTDEKKVVLLNEEVQIKEEVGQSCSSFMNRSIEQINGIKSEGTGSLSTNIDDDDDDNDGDGDDNQKLTILHEELNIKSDGDSSEKEFFYSNVGKRNSNFKIQPNDLQSDKHGLTFKDLEESTCNTTTFEETPSEIQMYKCEECDYKTKNKGSLKRHIQHRHTDSSISRKYNCDKCDYKFKLAQHLKQHIVAKHTDFFKIQKYKCEECDFKTKTKENLKKHIMCHHTDLCTCKEYRCDKCAKWQGNLKLHLLMKHSDPSIIEIYKCEECDYKGMYKHNLKRHILYHHTDSKCEQYKCDKCNFKTKHKESLKRHVLYHHNDSSESHTYKCDKCDYKSIIKESLKSHIRHRHTDSSISRKYNCDKCDFKFKLAQHLKQHLLAKHTDLSKIPMYKCEKCDYKGNYKHNLQKHILRRHTGSAKSEPYKCDKCNFKTNHKGSLTRHVLYRHTDPSKSKKFNCDKCDYKFKSRGDLKQHILVKHTDPCKIQMYKCEECDYKTKTEGKMKIHI